MAVSDPIADMLTKIRNASQAKHEKVDVTASNLKLQIIKILKNEGFIKNFKKVTKDDVTYIRIFLKYVPCASWPQAYLHTWSPCLLRLQGYAFCL